MTPAEDVATQAYRVDRMEMLFELDNRMDPAHEFHMLYTGLAEKYAHQDGIKVD